MALLVPRDILEHQGNPECKDLVEQVDHRVLWDHLGRVETLELRDQPETPGFLEVLEVLEARELRDTRDPRVQLDQVDHLEVKVPRVWLVQLGWLGLLELQDNRESVD
jgi:hypothetical protein